MQPRRKGRQATRKDFASALTQSCRPVFRGYLTHLNGAVIPSIEETRARPAGDCTNLNSRTAFGKCEDSATTGARDTRRSAAINGRCDACCLRIHRIVCPRSKRKQDRGMLWLKISIALLITTCLLYTSPSPRDGLLSRMPSSA